MGQRNPVNTVAIRTWGGLRTNVDSHDAKPGETQVQINATNVTPGQLTVRKGMVEVVWEN